MKSLHYSDALPRPSLCLVTLPTIRCRRGLNHLRTVHGGIWVLDGTMVTVFMGLI